MRRLLVLSYFFPPLSGGGVHRVLALTRHLPRFGWSCTVVCAGEEDYWVRDPSLLAEVPSETEVLRVRGPAGRFGVRRGRRSSRAFALLRAASSWLQMPDAYAGWSRRAAATAIERARRGDVDALLSTSPPDSVQLAGRAVARATGLPWVADFRDPWVSLYFKRPPTPWHRARQARLEALTLRSADRVTVASRTHLETLGAASGRPRAHALHWPNGFEPDVEPVAPSRDGPMLMVFTGTLNLQPAAETFLRALARFLARRPEARERVRVVMAGPHESIYPARARALGTGDVVAFPGALAHAEARALQRRADLLLLWRPPDPAFRSMVPGKLYEYLSARRPILALFAADDEAAALVRSAGGAVADPDAEDRVLAALETAYAEFPASRDRELPPAPGLEAHQRARLVERMAGWLDALIAEKRPSA